MAECGRHDIGTNESECLPLNFSGVDPLASVHTPMFEVVCELYLITALSVVGILGNVLAIVVMRHDVLRREALLLLQVLAVVDGFYLVFALARYPTRHFITSSEIYDKMQLYVFPMLKTCQAATIWIMVLVTVDRYIFVCWPLTAQQWCTGRSRRALAAAICAAALLFNLPRFFDSCVVEMVNHCTNSTVSYKIYRHQFNNRVYMDLYQNACYILFLYVGPLLALTVINCKLVAAIRNSRRFQQRSQPGEREYSDSNATLVLIIIVLVFVICETPELIIKIITVIDKHVEADIFGWNLINMNMVSALLVVLNSSINFFIYVAFGRRFRYIMKETFMYFAHSNGTMMTHETAPLQHMHRHGFPYNNKRFIM